MEPIKRLLSAGYDRARGFLAQIALEESIKKARDLLVHHTGIFYQLIESIVLPDSANSNWREALERYFVPGSLWRIKRRMDPAGEEVDNALEGDVASQHEIAQVMSDTRLYTAPMRSGNSSR